MKKKLLKSMRVLLVAAGLCVGANAWADAPVSGSDYLIKNVQTGYYLVGGIDWGTHACLHKMPQWFTLTGSENVYTLDSHQFNGETYHFLSEGLYVDGTTTDWTVTETATSGVFTIKHGDNYIAGNGVDAAITTTTDGTAAAAQWQLISYSDFVSSLEGVIGASGVDATPYIKDPELKRNGNFTTWGGSTPWTITGYDGTGTPGNFSQGQDGNNASCAESYHSTNGFKCVQTLTGLKPGQYKLTAQAFYRQDGSDTDNYPCLFVGDAKRNFPVLTGSEDGMTSAYASFLAGTYPVDPITFVVSSESENITIGYANANVSMWNIFGQTQLTYYGTCLVNDAVAFSNGVAMTANQWYYFDATVGGTYEFAATTLSDITFTTDGTQLTSGATGTTLTASESFSATRYYFKSTSAQTLTITVPTGAQVLNADIDFSNAISEGSVAGAVNSMALSQLTTTYDSKNNITNTAFELGYTSGETTTNGDVLRIGSGTGTVTIPDAQLAGTRDEVVITFDYYFGNLGTSNAGFYLYDGNETPQTIGGLYFCKYSNTEATNTFGVDRSQITAVGSSTASNAAILAATNKTSFEIHLNYATGTMYLKQSTNGTLKQTTTPVSMGSTSPLKTFVVQSNYKNLDRRCWFDNLVIYTIKGDYSVSEVSYTIEFKDGEGNSVKSDDTSRTALPGTSISDLATSADKTTFFNDGTITNNNTTEFEGATNKYVYSSVSAVNSSNETINELEAGATVTIVYTKYNKYTYTIKQKIGDNDATTLQSNTIWGDETYTHYYPVGVKSGDDYYFTTINGSSPYFSITATIDNPEPIISYTIDPTVAFYSEGEDLDSKTSTYTYFSTDMANGSSGVLNGDDGNLITSLGTGIYTIEARTIGRGNDDSHKIYFYKGSVSDETKLLTCSATTSGNIETSAAFELSETTNILIKGAQGGGANGNGLDYVIIHKYPSSIPATVTSAGWATLYSPYALDFSGVTGLAAYTATCSESTVTLTKVNTVPAGTGVVLKGAADTYNIPVIASSTTDKGHLLGSATGATAFNAYDGYTLYMLKMVSGNAQFVPMTSGSLAAGKAYLKIASGNSSLARSLNVVFADETTGIQTVQGEGVAADGYFNLSGQRVSQPTKGLYIVNGKKIIVK